MLLKPSNPTSKQTFDLRSLIMSMIKSASTGAASLAQVLGVGNTTGGTNIVVSAGDKIIIDDTASRIAGIGASQEVVSLDTATYPSLTELSYVKGVTSAIQTQLGNKITQNSWVDYSATSTIVGWSVFAEKRIQYIQVGNLVIYDIYITGTSNSSTTSITIAHTISERILISNYGNNNGTVSMNRLVSTAGSSTLTFDVMNSLTSVTSFSGSNTKLINFQFIIKV